MRYLSVILLTLACSAAPIAPQVPLNAEMMTPPEIYRDWWRGAEACAGVTGDFDQIRWWIVPGYSWVLTRNNYSMEINGLQYRDNIYVAAFWASDKALVTHEILHALGFVHPDGILDPMDYPWPFRGCATEP